MTIWFKPVDLAQINTHAKGTLSDFVGIQFTEAGEDFLVATMEVTSNVRQPMGIMHGGISCVLAETVGSTAANLCINFSSDLAVGLDINTNHVRQISSGLLKGVAKPFHIGENTHVWGIEIFNSEEKIISVSRLTMAVLKNKNGNARIL